MKLHCLPASTPSRPVMLFVADAHRMKALPSWQQVHAAIDRYTASLKGSAMVAV